MSTKIMLSGSEDEMVFFQRDGRNIETLFASCPEQARDFVKKFKRKRFAGLTDLEAYWAYFKNAWKSKYKEEEI